MLPVATLVVAVIAMAGVRGGTANAHTWDLAATGLVVAGAGVSMRRLRRRGSYWAVTLATRAGPRQGEDRA